jgi:hypothetical protein
MNKKSIAPRARNLYPAQAIGQIIDRPKRSWLLWNIWGSSVPKLHVIKRGLMQLRLFWRRLAILAGEIRTQAMVEIERNPLAVRQGAATIMCLAAAAVAMPVISHRAAEQRDTAEWATTSAAFQQQFEQQVLAADVQLTSFTSNDGLRARGTSTLFESPDARAMLVQAALRGPSNQPTPDQAVPEPQVDQRQHACLSQAIYYEARGETQRGQIAVAEVIMNRARSGYYPASVCGVVFQGSHRSTGCQFTFTCDGSLNHRPRGRAWDRAQRVATAVLMGYTRPITQGATHYHTHAVNPVWNSGLVETTSIESHVFYRFPNRSERAYYQEALARRRGLGVRRGTAAEELIPETDDVALEGVEGAVTEDAPVATAPAAAETPAAEEEVAT